MARNTTMPASQMHKTALEYIRNAGGAPEVAWFDDDHEPIGPNLRADLGRAGLVNEYEDGATETKHIELTDAGKKEIG